MLISILISMELGLNQAFITWEEFIKMLLSIVLIQI